MVLEILWALASSGDYVLSIDLYTIYILSMVVISVVMVAYMVLVTIGPRGKKEPEKRVVTVLRCPKCGYKKIREFREGDYVGKIVDEKCPKCNVSLVIDAIYEENIMGLSQAVKNKKSKGKKEAHN